MSRWTAVETIGRGVQAAPALKTGFVGTLALAMVGAGGRVVVPILVQQAIDHGFDGDRVDVDRIVTLAVIGIAAVLVATVAQLVVASVATNRSSRYGTSTRATRRPLV